MGCWWSESQGIFALKATLLDHSRNSARWPMTPRPSLSGPAQNRLAKCRVKAAWIAFAASAMVVFYVILSETVYSRCGTHLLQLHRTAVLQLGPSTGYSSAQPTSQRMWKAALHWNYEIPDHLKPLTATRTLNNPQQVTADLIEQAKVQQAALRPVVIGIVGRTGSGHLSGLQSSGRLNPEQPWHEPNCSYKGIPIECIFTVKQSDYSWADGLYFHTPAHPGRIMAKQHPNQLRFAVSMESAVNYPWQDDPNYMCQYDVEATYRSCSQVPNNFHHERHQYPNGSSMLDDPELPFEQKVHAVAYINSNCGTRSERASIMRQWMELSTKGGGKMQIHSYGLCDNNRRFPHNTTKIELFRRYKFCIAMENSMSHDYVTEKIWDGLAAGCVPIYLGSTAYRDIVPDPDGVILYGPGGNASTVSQLDELLDRLGSDARAYKHLLRWKHEPMQKLNPGYQAYRVLVKQNNECRMCAHIIKHRMSTQNTTYTTCLWNQTWMEKAGKTIRGPRAC